jgi:cysteinyl-tRNA synthetase
MRPMSHDHAGRTQPPEQESLVSEPSPDVFPLLVRQLKQWNELARTCREYEMANAFKGMARHAGPDDVEALLDEIMTLWQEIRRAKVWDLADGIRQGLQTLPGLVIDDRGPVRWHFK